MKPRRKKTVGMIKKQHVYKPNHFLAQIQKKSGQKWHRLAIGRVERGGGGERCAGGKPNPFDTDHGCSFSVRDKDAAAVVKFVAKNEMRDEICGGFV
ncbi:hypothetical protein CTI12_AA383010 [Artemisia annua]|uniref:Uncharacterized protein n=1 Tax=Artemisia annua TaxID=35608 RepID=A0A2U1MGQ1_ARTAN|nr:hypothetical protein CTI12_AA383010 [Artemisia annua]